jgi:hypothetical protein
MLFGHQNDDSNKPAEPDMGTPGVNPLAVDAETGASLPTAPTTQPESEAPKTEETSVLNQTVSAPASDTATDDASVAPASLDEPKEEQVVAPSTPPATTSDDSSDVLLDLKQQALTKLSPLLNHLEQTPEERFRTTMMLIQSTDNQAMLKDAYEAANNIPDEKVRAQALLDVVNEINYFTQPKAS